MIAFLAAFPAIVSFVKWRSVSFNSRLLAYEFFAFFAFFFCNIISSGYILKILYPLFLLFIIQKDLFYSFSRKIQTNFLFLICVNSFLQVFIYECLRDVYAYDLLDLFAVTFSIFIAFKIGWEYYLTAYIPKVSRFFMIGAMILCMLFDIYIFRFIFMLFVFYITLERRNTELLDSGKTMDDLLSEQNKIKAMMNEISNSIKDFSNKKDAANSYLNSLCRLLSARGAAIYEWDNNKKEFFCIAVNGLYFPLGIGSEKLFTKVALLREMAFNQRIKDERSVIWKCAHNGVGTLLSHSSDDMEVLLGNLSQEVHSIILVPLVQESDILGVLVIENKLGNDYLTETDFDMAKSFANFAAIILNTSRISEQRNENMRMSTELNSGNLLQSSLLSYEIPRVEGIEVSYFMAPAKEIGGDYYDFFENGEKLALVIGDVSGKGVSAGIIVAIMQTYLQNEYRRTSDLKQLIVDLNAYLSNKISNGMFVTLLFFEWDSKQNKLRYVSCGHEHILHYRAKDKTVETIRSGGLALMMDNDIDPYINERELVVEKGDCVILYTDGVTETFSPSREIFGLERLVKFFQESAINKASIEKMLPQTLNNWRGDGIQTDDITCMLMEF